MSQRKRASLGVIFLTLFIDLMGFSILFPLFAEMMAHYSQQPTGLLHGFLSFIDGVVPGASPTQQAALFGGCLMGIYSVLQFISSPLWGALSDRIGRRPVLMLTICGNTLGYALWIFADAFWVLVLSRALCGLMAGNIGVATAAVADVTDEKSRAKGMGFVGMAFGFGFILGPAIGGLAYTFLPQWSGDGLGFGLNPFSAAAMIAVSLSALNLVWVASRFAETKPQADKSAPSEQRQFSPLALFTGIRPPALRAIVWSNLLFTVLFAGMEATLVFLAAEQLSWGPGQMAWLFVVMGLTSALIQGGLVRRLAPRIGERRLALAGMVIMAVAFLGIASVALVPSSLLLYAAICVLALGIGLTMPTLAALASLATPDQEQGYGLGAYRSAGALGRAIGPFVGAGLYFGVGALGPYVVGACGMVLPLLILARTRVSAGAQPEPVVE